MGKIIARRPRPGIVLAALLAALSLAALTRAVIPGTDGQINACYNKRGLLRVVDDGVSCKKRETALTWNDGSSPVAGTRVVDDSLTGADIDESTLGEVPLAAVAASAASATNADTATNATMLGGAAASEYVRRCGNGSVWGRAEINGGTASASLDTAGVNAVKNFNCAGADVYVRRTGTGNYDVVFDDGADNGTFGIGSGNGPIPIATAVTVGTIVSAQGPFNCASPPPGNSYVTCFQVRTRSDAGAAVDASFAIALL